MKTVMRYSIGTIILIIISLRIYLHDALPIYSGEKKVAGLQKTVDIFTDKCGSNEWGSSSGHDGLLNEEYNGCVEFGCGSPNTTGCELIEMQGVLTIVVQML